MTQKHTLHIVIPCYNESQRIDCTAFVHFLNQSQYTDTVITFVNDRSTDKTLSILQEIQQQFQARVHIITYPKNK